MLAGTLLALALAVPAIGRDTTPSSMLKVAVDSGKHLVVITAGPYDLPNMPPMDDHEMKDLGMSHDTPVMRFQWPVDGWFRGFRWELVDSAGRPLPKEALHHMIMVNFDRRQLIYPAAERLMGIGTETADVSVPKSIGVPMTNGMDLGMYIAWHNSTGRDLKGVYLKLSMMWTPTNQNPRPLNAMPIYMDVNLTVGASNMFDVPPGHSEKSFEFELPMGGRLLGVGGHLHDYGSYVKLVDVVTGKELTRVTARRAPDGKVEGVSRKLFGVSGQGLELKAHHPYKVVGVYDNPTGELRKNGAMAHMVGLFVPDDMALWPKVDLSDTTFQKDLASLNVRGGEEHEMMDHNMHDMPGMDRGRPADPPHDGHSSPAPAAGGKTQ